MDKTIMGLLSGASALALMGGAQTAPAAAEPAIQPASSFAELLEPIPNAVELLNADNERAASNAAAGEHPVQLAQYYYHHHHHHHYRHHHHHHHHHYYHHHHHHHHHHHYYHYS
ncbi:MAG: hypothetical protein JO223_25595 [Hyphomicrobiales bacterium]|nr:hypothetical protein [Hyphomicrobiales bacterium]